MPHFTYELLVPLLNYPGPDFHKRVAACRDGLLPEEPESAGLVERFAQAIQGLSTEEAEELYTRTFDMKPLCTLDVGWHLFGQEYNRGSFLAKVRRELASHGVPESNELPDHLSHLLPLLARMESREAEKFATACVIPAVEKMLEALAKNENPYENVLQAVLCLLRKRHGFVTEESVHG